MNGLKFLKKEIDNIKKLDNYDKLKSSKFKLIYKNILHSDDDDDK